MRFVRSLAIAICLLSPSILVAQTYNANATVKITAVFTYTSSDRVYFTVEERPTGITCGSPYFGLPLDMPADRRAIVVSRLLLAYSLKEPVNIGFDATGPCYDGESVWVGRVG